MPLYEYKCEKCTFEFEELVVKSSFLVKCRRCGGEAKQKMSAFSSKVQGSLHESVDVKIGREADKRWQMLHERQKKRRSEGDLESVELPKVKGQYTPVMALGSQEDKKKRSEYSISLQRHRQERLKRGQKQFSETGSF